MTYIINALEQYKIEQHTNKHIAELNDTQLLKQISIDGIIHKLCCDEMFKRIKRKLENV